MADYSFSPQFANLSGLQPLPAIDVTRGGALQFQPLQAIKVESTHPELIGQSIAGAVSNIAQGALSGITARWEKGEAEEREARKYAQEEKIAKIKAAQGMLEKGEQRAWEWEKMHEQDKLIRERKKGALPGGFFGSDEGELPIEESSVGDDSSVINPITGEDVDMQSTLPEMSGVGEQLQAYPLSAITEDQQRQIAENVAKDVKSLSVLQPSELSVSTGAGPISKIPEEKPALTLQGIDASFISPEKGQEIAQARLGLREAIKETKKPTQEALEAGIYPVTSKSQSDRLLRMPLAENVKSAKLIRNPQTGQYAYVVEQMTPAEIAEKEMKQEESKSKISSRKQYEGQKQERLYQQYITAAQNEPSVKSLEDPKFGMSKFTAEIPEFYQQYKDYLAQAEAAKIKGDKKTELYNRRMVAETVNAIIDSFTRLASGKAVTEGQLNMIKKESIDPLQQFTRMTDSWLKGGVVAPDEQVRSIAKIATSMGNEAAEKANYFILGQREKFKEQGVPEKNLPKFYPQDIGFENEAKRTLGALTDDYEVKSQQYDEIKDSTDPKDQYKIDVLRKQLELLDYRIDSLKERITGNELLAKKGKKKQILGHKEFVDRPTGLRDMYGISPFQQMMQQMQQSQQPISE